MLPLRQWIGVAMKKNLMVCVSKEYFCCLLYGPYLKKYKWYIYQDLLTTWKTWKVSWKVSWKVFFYPWVFDKNITFRLSFFYKQQKLVCWEIKESCCSQQFYLFEKLTKLDVERWNDASLFQFIDDFNWKHNLQLQSK